MGDIGCLGHSTRGHAHICADCAIAHSSALTSGVFSTRGEWCGKGFFIEDGGMATSTAGAVLLLFVPAGCHDRVQSLWMTTNCLDKIE